MMEGFKNGYQPPWLTAQMRRVIWTCLCTSLAVGGLHRHESLSLGTPVKAHWGSSIVDFL